MRPPRDRNPNALTNHYRCRDDRWLMLTVLNEERQFPALAAALECAELVDDARFSSAAARRANHVALIAVLDQAIGRRDLADWRERLDRAGITFGVVGTTEDLLHDEQARAAGVIVPFADGAGLTISSPIRLEGVTQVAPRRAPATVGEHSTQILRDAGFGDDEIRQLREDGVVAGT